MSFYNRILSLHPAVVTIGFVVLLVGGGVALNINPLTGGPFSVVFSVVNLLLLGALMLWHYSLYRVASARNARSAGHSGRRGFLFVLAIVGTGTVMVIAPLLVLSPGPAQRMLLTVQSVAMPVGVLSYFAAIWAAANALTRFDDRTKSAELHKTLGTFILELYLPIGIWVIYPRVKRLLAA